MEFIVFKRAIQTQFKKMKKHELFRVTVDKDLLWNTYLDSFPEGTNPIFKERRKYDCNCCKSFISSAGNMVAIINGKIESIWDVQVGGHYQVVADALSAMIKLCPIENVFYHTERVAGTDKNFQDLMDGKIATWNHFFINIPDNFVLKGEELGPRLSDTRSLKEVLFRSLKEITIDSIQTVLELIDQNSIYRGKDHEFAVNAFLELKKEFDKIPNELDKELFCWVKFNTVPGSVSKIRNTSIGTLLTDLSGNVELEKAVKTFEKMVAPENYKRSTALASKSMIESAQKKIEELGLLSALERRPATIDDITINNVMWANRESKKSMNENIFDKLAKETPEKVKNYDKVEEMTIEQFITNILPKANSLEIMFENSHINNLVSLIAPLDPTSGNMFKWDNKFCWDYNGCVADSMRQRVSELGGRVDGALRFTHSWNHPDVGRNASLMDLHVFMPGSSKHEGDVNYEYPTGRRVGWNLRKDFHSRASQDVDYVNAAPDGYIPIENISFPDIKLMPEGKYTFKIHNWKFRAPTTSGFKAEIEFAGQIFSYDHPAPLKNKEWVTLAEVTLKNGVFTIEHKLTSKQSSVIKWNIATQVFHNINVMMLSPNFWDGQGVGNKHYFFMLNNCFNDGKVRGFYNEFLKEELNVHRKVFEMVGSKMSTVGTERQLSGLGFSVTQRNSVLCRVKGSFSRVVKINF